MSQKLGVLMLCSKDLQPNAATEWLTFYMPFSGVNTYMELQGQSIELVDAVQWIGDNYVIDTAQLEKLGRYVSSGKVPSFNGFEATPRTA